MTYYRYQLKSKKAEIYVQETVRVALGGTENIAASLDPQVIRRGVANV